MSTPTGPHSQAPYPDQQQPTYVAPDQQPTPQPPGPPKGLALAALIVGIAAFLLGLIPVLGIVLGLAGVTLGVIALVKKQPKAFALTGLILAAIAIIASSITTAGIGAAVDTVSKELEKVETEAPEPVATEEPVEEEPAVDEEPAPAPEPEVPAEPQLTLGQTNAVRSAKQYLDYSGFSRTGLIGQLEFEGFSTEDATFGADNAGADWMAEAAESAQSYLDYTSFSRQGLIDQLIFEGFTPEEAEHGVTAVGY